MKTCCGIFPSLKPDNAYPGSVRYECPKCHRTTIPCYSTLGDSIKMAEESWDLHLNITTEPPGIQKATELEYFEFWRRNAGDFFGPGEQDCVDELNRRFREKTGKELPDGWGD